MKRSIHLQTNPGGTFAKSVCGLTSLGAALDARPWRAYDVSPPKKRCKKCERGWRMARPHAMANPANEAAQ